MSALQPLLKAAAVMRNEKIVADHLRTAFPYQRRTLATVIKLSNVLDERLPRCERSGHRTCNSIDAAPMLPISGPHFAAARWAIDDLGPNAPHHKRLSHAAAILEEQQCPAGSYQS
tara:strand:+ start:2139 stop:2486 length:348 start_codon:yes stop_codon:yes gene_type:complete